MKIIIYILIIHVQFSQRTRFRVADVFFLRLSNPTNKNVQPLTFYSNYFNLGGLHTE